MRLLLFIALISSAEAWAQQDSLRFTNGNYMVGEIISMQRGVLIFETDYSDSDFNINWDGIAEIYARNYFLIRLSNGQRITGNLASLSSDAIEIYGNQDTSIATLSDVVYLKAVDRDFWSRVYASIDFGLSITKANDLRQLNTRSNLGYIADTWSVTGSFSNLISQQNNAATTRRTDGTGSFNYFLPQAWFVPANLSFLSNTQQKLDLRSNLRVGIGKYFLQTNQSYWGFSLGAAFNNERFSTEAEERNNAEAYLGSELNLYDVGDLNVLTTVVLYQGLTESDRFRSDIKFDVKYDLPLDFYIKTGFTLNYDSKPTAGASQSDYVIQTGLGWEL